MVNGYFKGLKPGTATITVRTVDGDFSDTCTVKVLGADEIYEGIKMDEKEIEAEVGVLTMVSAHPYPDDGKICLMRFESSDPEIVYFENNIDTYINSYFKGLKPGTATVTVRTVEGGFSDTCVVTVKGKETTPEVPDTILEKKEELELKKKLIGVVLRLLLDHIK